MIIGVTGHQQLSDPTGWKIVRAEVRRFLSHLASPVVGLSSLAVGADQLFAEEVLRVHGQLRAILPFDGYESRFPASAQARYQRVLKAAAAAEILQGSTSDEASYLLAGRYIVDHCQVLLAVWDGRAARGTGGTADTVEYATQRGVPIHLIDVSVWRAASWYETGLGSVTD